MPELLKNAVFSEKFFEMLQCALLSQNSKFPFDKFYSSVLNEDWKNMELKQRLRHLSKSIRPYLPERFEDAAELLCNTVPFIMNEYQSEQKFGFMFFPDFVELYGLDDFEVSVHALERMTSLASAEFAVRPFLVQYPDLMLDKMKSWAVDDNEHIRRLASEGCRPRLPWAPALHRYKQNPGLIVPILDLLKDDVSGMVRRSVANNLNDIAKDSPEYMLDIATQWLGTSSNTDKMLKHACRTLLKKGNSRALSLFNMYAGKFSVQNLRVSNTIAIGEQLLFSFSILSEEKTTRVARVEYAVYYCKANGGRNKKVFFCSEKNFLSGEIIHFNRKQSFREMTTRKHYPGIHKMVVIVNGLEIAGCDFTVTKV